VADKSFVCILNRTVIIAKVKLQTERIVGLLYSLVLVIYVNDI